MEKEVKLNENTTLVFAEFDDNAYRIYVDVDSNDFYKQQGELKFDEDRKLWIFWQENGDGVDYYESLDETIDEITFEYQDEVKENPDYFKD